MMPSQRRAPTAAAKIRAHNSKYEARMMKRPREQQPER
jgi:hypothetical protein